MRRLKEPKVFSSGFNGQSPNDWTLNNDEEHNLDYGDGAGYGYPFAMTWKGDGFGSGKEDAGDMFGDGQGCPRNYGDNGDGYGDVGTNDHVLYRAWSFADHCCEHLLFGGG